MKWLPNFFIAGAPKAGTSSVHQWIADHPDALGSKEKETYFLVDPGTHMYRPTAHIAMGLEAWQSQFDFHKEVSPKVILESTPSYIYSKTAQTVIPQLETKPKCLFILREPSAQIQSLYTYFKNNWDWVPSSMSFQQFIESSRQKSHTFKGNELAINALEYAKYVYFLRIWRDALGADRIMVRNFEDLLTDQKSFVKEVAAWLGLDASYYDTYEFPRENQTYIPKNRSLQKLNIAARGLLPKGKLYNNLRFLYRSLNTTTKKVANSDEEVATLAALQREFKTENLLLKEEFGVSFKGDLKWAS